MSGVRVGALQEAAVAADDLLARIAGEAAEGVVDEDDRVVGQPRVRDHHGHAGGAHRCRERVGAVVDARDLLDDAGGISRVARPGERLPKAGDLGLGFCQPSAQVLDVAFNHVG